MKRFCVALLLTAWSFCAMAAEKSGVVVSINGSKYYVHTVQAGETLYGLSKLYAVGEQVIVAHNPEAAAGLKAGASLRIPYVSPVAEQMSEKKIRRTFTQHYVAKGETLYGISRAYEIPIPTLIEDNPTLDPIRLRPGERILVRKKKIGSEDEAGSRAQWEEYRSSLTSIAAPGDAYHIVKSGETFYSLSKRYGISEATLSQLNGGLKPSELKAGAMIRVPNTEAAATPPLPPAEAYTIPPESVVYEPGVAPAPADEPEKQEPEEQTPTVDFRALNRSRTLNVSLLLPMATDSTGVNGNYLEFYQGFLLGLDSVKYRYGCSVNLTLFNTGRDREKVEEFMRSAEFRRSDLIVGPIYEEETYPVVRFAERKGIPVVSPLAHNETLASDALFQLAPDPASKYEKIADLLNGDRLITLIYTADTDREFEAEMLALIGDRPYRKHTYRYEHPNDIAKRQSGYSPADLTPLLNNEDDNVFIIMADNEVDVDRILAALASADTSITARSRIVPQFAVLGNARWNRYVNIDRTMFFKDRVVLLSTYHAKRDSEIVKAFDGAYIRAFGALPTLYSYRGFDTAMIFCPAMYDDIANDMEGRRYQPLQTGYVFRQKSDRANHVNHNWTRVNYHADYTITIE